MARIYADLGFDQSNFDLSLLYYNAFDSQFLNNCFVENRGRLIEDMLVVSYLSDGELAAVGLAGTGFRMIGDHVTGGTLTNISQVVSDGEYYRNHFEFDRISLPLVDFHDATLSFSRADDNRLIDRVLSGDDLFELSFQADRAFGMGGNDTLYGFEGNDTLGGGAGRDALYGGRGADRLILSSQDDILDGGLGRDWLAIKGATGARIDLARTDRQDTGHGMDRILNIENLQGGAGADRLGGNAQDNLIQGGGGADGLSGRRGSDRLLGQDGNDTLDGAMGADLLEGGRGSDRLIGGMGADQLTGGMGADVFVFRALDDSRSTGRDLVTDFNARDDRIDLGAIDADRQFAGNSAFTLQIGGEFEPGHGGQLIAIRGAGSTPYTNLLMDVNGDGQADAAIRLAGYHALTEANFIL
nr:M10 family metallopeptidase C-terminal domain-containing protein [Paracoccus saliphilus]